MLLAIYDGARQQEVAYQVLGCLNHSSVAITEVWVYLLEADIKRGGKEDLAVEHGR